MDKPTILIDNQEKRGWTFAIYDCKTKVVNLNTGDYTVEGYEEYLCVERKGSTGELAINLGKLRATFERELQRMESFTHKYIICEFPESNFYCFPVKSGIPPSSWKKVKINGKYLLKTLHELADKYNIELIFCADKTFAEATCISIISDITGVEYENTW